MDARKHVFVLTYVRTYVPVRVLMEVEAWLLVGARTGMEREVADGGWLAGWGRPGVPVRVGYIRPSSDRYLVG
jgi:hypothetical protein